MPLWRQNQSRKLDPQIAQIPQIPSCCALPIACCLLTTTFDQSFVSRLVVHIEENAGIGDFHELRRVAVFADDRIGGIFGGERQQLRKQVLADNDGVAAFAFVSGNEDRRVGGFEALA